MNSISKNDSNWKQGKGNVTVKTANSPLIYGKVPPQAPQLENGVLGAVMLEKGAYELVAGILDADSFYVDANQKVWEAIQTLTDKGMAIDLLTVTEELRRNGNLAAVGGAHYVTKLTTSVVSSAHVEDHARLVKEKALSREMIRIGGNMVRNGYDDADDVFDQMDYAEGAIIGLSSGINKGGYSATPVLAKGAVEAYHDRKANPSDITGVPTGYYVLNKITRGWQPSDLIILAARPSVGKTAFAMNLAVNAASNPTKPSPVGFFSLEMSKGQLTNRALSSIGDVWLEYILNGRLDESEEERFLKAAEKFSCMPIFIDDTPGLNIYQLRSKARQLKLKHDIQLIIIDYLQLMSGVDPTRTGNREQEVSKISRDLKALAKELEIPIIALSQLNRESEKPGDNKGPQLSHLRESGSIEQDADMVIFLYRQGYQKTDTEVNPMIKDDANIKIAKHRNGKTDVIVMKTVLEIQTWFDTDAYDHYKNPRTQKVPAWQPFNNNSFDKDSLPF